MRIIPRLSLVNTGGRSRYSARQSENLRGSSRWLTELKAPDKDDKQSLALGLEERRLTKHCTDRGEVGYLVFAPLFALIYVKGYERGKPGLGQGFRCGLYVGAMLSVMHSFGWYVILPIPLVLAFYWFLAILVEFIAAGMAAGLVYRE